MDPGHMSSGEMDTFNMSSEEMDPVNMSSEELLQLESEIGRLLSIIRADIDQREHNVTGEVFWVSLWLTKFLRPILS